jgi:hypothetical protein
MKGKDESSKEEKLIYKVPCKQCDRFYIGQTRRKREMRMSEHRSHIKKMDTNSKLVEHIGKHQNHFNFDKVGTLAWENDWRRRTIEESLLT